MLLQRLYAWACERLYAEWAWSYDWVSWCVSLGYWPQWRALALGYVRGPRCLELGFGTGELLPLLAAHTTLTVGLDPAAAMHRQTLRKLTAHGLSVPLVQARAQAMPFPDGAFDSIVATFPAPYILEAATLHECARLLSGQGNPQAKRLVIVGLWVALAANGWERAIPLFYGRPSHAIQQQMMAHLVAAGFAPVIEERAVGIFRVGILIAERSGTQPHG